MKFQEFMEKYNNDILSGKDFAMKDAIMALVPQYRAMLEEKRKAALADGWGQSYLLAHRSVDLLQNCLFDISFINQFSRNQIGEVRGRISEGVKTLDRLKAFSRFGAGIDLKPETVNQLSDFDRAIYVYLHETFKNKNPFLINVETAPGKLQDLVDAFTDYEKKGLAPEEEQAKSEAIKAFEQFARSAPVEVPQVTRTAETKY